MLSFSLVLCERSLEVERKKKKYLLCPFSVIGRFLAVKRWADHNYVHAAVSQRDEVQETGLH
jgi:hypothetical protein